MVSRPPSCHLPRVDEEPSTTSKNRETEIETVDRGVGPTPHPPHVDPHDPRDLRDPRFPHSYFGFPPLIDPRNGLFDPQYSGKCNQRYSRVSIMVFNNVSVISWRSVFLVGETRVPGENHRPAASH